MLLIDCHEPREIIENLILTMPLNVLRLKYGDYSFSNVIIERKTLSDFFSSLKSNRLKEQMENMSRYYTEKYLLIEVFFDFEYVNNVDYLYTKLSEVILNFDIKVIFSKDYDCTAILIKKIYFKKNFGYAMNTVKRSKIYHATRFFDISYKKLEVLYSKFGSISEIATADKKELKGIKSIGKKTIEKLRNTINLNIFED
ncbi:hypothetical protein HYW99_00905 [Candidatus Woesearchaeota archaeon]|nr:hypothetical protein [Candidatus Woesearchaeota archaeon]